MPNAIETQSLRKDFGKFHAVVDASITVKGGCIYGFIGKNGAGKTTVITAFLVFTIALTVLFFAAFRNQDEMSYNE